MEDLTTVNPQSKPQPYPQIHPHPFMLTKNDLKFGDVLSIKLWITPQLGVIVKKLN